MTDDTPRVYLAGPDSFHPNAEAITANKIAICEKYGLAGIAPRLPGASGPPGRAAAMARYRDDLARLTSCQALIANMSPFRGTGMDAGTAFEMGMMAGLSRPVVAYSLDRRDYAQRITELHAVIGEPLKRDGDRLETSDGIEVEAYGLADNYKVSCAAEAAAAPLVHEFEEAVRWARRLIR